MTAEELFLKEGASYFGNRLIYRNQDVGYKSESGLSLLPEGEEIHKRLADITDVEVKVKPARAKKPAPAVDATPEASLDDLLAE